METELKFTVNDNQVLFWQDEETKKNYALHIEQDPDAIDPISNDLENPVKLACWHKRSSFGTPNLTDGMSTHDFWCWLVKSNLTDTEILEKLQNGQLSNVQVCKNVDDPEKIDLTITLKSESHKHNGIRVCTIWDYIENEVTIPECQTLLYTHLISLPIWAYEHSGITISCGDRVWPYNDQFDSGLLGWAYCTKKALLKIDPEISDWKATALQQIRSTVKTYDNYLTGEVYWYELFETTVPFRAATKDDWESVDSCGNFIGDDLFESGIADAIAGRGFMQAFQAKTYATGHAKTIYIPQTTFVID